MDPQTFMEVATVVKKLKMYPYFDIAHYTLMCMISREDHPVQTGQGQSPFSRKHPLACWIASMMLCFAGGIIGNLMVGEPLVTPFKDHHNVLVATGVWYLLNYSPFDVVYKIVRFTPIRLVISVMKEVQRTSKIHHAIVYAMKLYPNSYLIIVMIGVIKGCGYYYMRNFERLVRGSWMPSSNEFLQPSFVTKASLAASVIFILEKLHIIQAPHVLIYFGVVIFLVYFRISAIVLGIADPFVPFENLFCAIFMGGIFDALKRAVMPEKKPEEDKGDHRNDFIKNKEDKKKD